MRHGPWRTLMLLALCGSCCAAGCSGGPRLAEVKGTVRLNGKPLPKVMVEFRHLGVVMLPDDGKN